MVIDHISLRREWYWSCFQSFRMSIGRGVCAASVGCIGPRWYWKVIAWWRKDFVFLLRSVSIPLCRCRGPLQVYHRQCCFRLLWDFKIKTHNQNVLFLIQTISIFSKALSSIGAKWLHPYIWALIQFMIFLFEKYGKKSFHLQDLANAMTLEKSLKHKVTFLSWMQVARSNWS